MTRFRGARADLGFALWHHHTAPLPELLGSGFVGEMLCMPTHVREAHAHDLLEITYVVAGRGERVCGGERAVVGAGDACLIAPGAWHGAAADPRDPYHYYTLSFDAARFGLRLSERDRVLGGDDATPLALELRVDGQRVIRRCHGADDVFRRMILALDRHELDRRGPRLTEALLRALIAELLVALAGGLLADRGRVEVVADGGLRREFRDLVAWLPERIAAPPTLAEMAQRVGLSPAHFAHAFKQDTGRTPHEFLGELRIEEAARRLRADPERPIALVASELGFGTASWFATAFRRAKGCSPGEWRALAACAS